MSAEERFDEVRRIGMMDALRRIPGPNGSRIAEVFRHGSLSVKVYSPESVDHQTPHEQDEIYVVMKGFGTYLSDAGKQTVHPGDFLFAPAGVEHRFEGFTADFAVWVFFYGPQGGERET